MRPPDIINNDNDNKQSSTTTTIEINNYQQKRSLEDYGFSTNLKRRRHLSSQNTNIDTNNDNGTMILSSVGKKTRANSRKQSILNSSIDKNNEHNSMCDRQSSRVSNFSYSIISLKKSILRI